MHTSWFCPVGPTQSDTCNFLFPSYKRKGVFFHCLHLAAGWNVGMVAGAVAVFPGHERKKGIENKWGI
jgi:hypothetical protein